MAGGCDACSHLFCGDFAGIMEGELTSITEMQELVEQRQVTGCGGIWNFNVMESFCGEGKDCPKEPMNLCAAQAFAFLKAFSY